MFSLIFYFIFGIAILTIVTLAVIGIIVSARKSNNESPKNVYKLPTLDDDEVEPTVIIEESKNCEYCGSELKGEDSVCPSCGAKRKK